VWKNSASESGIKRSVSIAACYLILLAAIFPLAFRQVTVSDAWWHVALGKWLVVMRSMPDLSRFYFTPVDAGSLASELRWEWLGDIFLYLAYAAGGAVGIQWLVVACALGGLVFLADGFREHRGPWLLMLLGVVCLGTYQLQLARNSAYSLVLYPALLWLGTRKSGPPSWREYAAVTGLLVLWSCLHGSCSLGWVTACALYGPRALSGFRRSSPEPQWTIRAGLRSCAAYIAAMAISLAAISIGRGDAMHFIGQPFRHVTQSAGGLSKPTAPESPEAAPQKMEVAAKPTIKEWLNSSIWKRDPAVPWSNDYWSPIDMLPGMRPIEAAYALALLAGILVTIRRNVPVGLVLAWGGAVFLGLGYVRMFGYTALASGAVIVMALSNCKQPHWLRVFGWAAFAGWLVFFWGLFFSARIDAFIPSGQHVSKLGKAPIYDDATADWVKSEFPQEKVFTTIETGSYCVLRWNFERQVFLDGFFAPHTREVWGAYNEALASSSPDALHNQHRATMAIIPTTSPQWVDIFRHSEDWSPVAIGSGTVVFAHNSATVKIDKPKIFFTAEDMRATSFYFREATLKSLFLIVAGGAGKLFGPDQWSSIPEFENLRSMAGEVFPRAQSEAAPGFFGLAGGHAGAYDPVHGAKYFGRRSGALLLRTGDGVFP
jgi:hypothetical protein